MKDTAPSRGAALLIAGYRLDAEPADATTSVQLLGRVGEALLATRSGWRVARVSPHGTPTMLPTRTNVERELRTLHRDVADLAIVIATGSVVAAGDGEPALLTSAIAPGGSSMMGLPTAELLPLSALCTPAHASPMVIVVGGWAAYPPAAGHGARVWLDAFSPGRPDDLIVIAADDGALAVIEDLYAGFSGAAVDPSTGTITIHSLGRYLARAPGNAVVMPAANTTLMPPPPLAGVWDPRLTRGSLRAPLEPSAPERNRDELIGTILPGRFRIDAEIARGAFGAVYRARQLAVDRDVAVKVMHASVDPSSPSGRLFVHEIQSVGRIDHPHVVRIHHADVTSDGRLFFAMELLAGCDLEQVIQHDGRLSQDRAVELVRQLLAGLEAAHDAGLVHADLKPANVLVVPARAGERIVLVDFGLSRLRVPDSPARSIGGTPAYMAPEQLRNGRVDARSDLFAAALVLVTLITGWRRRAKHELAPPLDDICDDHLRATLHRALAIDPADRFQTAGELAAALSSSRSTDASTAGPPNRIAPVLADAVEQRAHGRAREIDELVDAVLYRRIVLVAGRAGIGKTSVVRDGLAPRLAALGARVIYAAWHRGIGAELASTIAPEARGIGEGLRNRAARDAGKVVLIIDQLEAALNERARTPDREVLELLAADRWPPGMDLAVVACVRDNALETLRARSLGVAAPVVRIAALDDDGAREAITAPFTARRIAVDDELLAALIRDLRRAAADLAASDGAALDGCYPPHLRAICAQLYEGLRDEEATLTLAHYERLGGARAILDPTRGRVAHRRRSAAIAGRVAIAIAGAAAVAAIWLRGPSAVRGGDSSPPTRTTPPIPGPAAALPVAAQPRLPTIVIGGSGTLLWGFFAPLDAFLEELADVTIPITSQNDLGSGGAMQALRAGRLDIAALSRRHTGPADEASARKLLVEVAIGFDETSLFVWRNSPVRTMDLASVRAHLCCKRGTEIEPLSWKNLGVTTPALAAQPVTWLAFGRKRHARPKETTSATLALADDWLCAPDRLCASSIDFDGQANDVLPVFVKDMTSLALSSRSFATDQVAAVTLVDHEHRTHLDGRKVLWIYASVDARTPVPAKLCRFFRAVLDPAVAGRLASSGKAFGLPDPLRERQRAALGLDDGRCEQRSANALAARAEDAASEGFLASPIADEVEVKTRWVRDP